MAAPKQFCTSNRGMKSMVRLALAGFFPKSERIHSVRRTTTNGSALASLQHQKSVSQNCVSKLPTSNQQKSNMDTISRFSNNMPLRTRLQERSIANNLLVASPRTPSIGNSTRQHSTSTGNVRAESPSTNLTTPSRESTPDINPVPKCLTVRKRHTARNIPPAPANSASSSNADEEEPRTPLLPRSRSFLASRQERMKARPVLHRQLSNFTRIEQEITYYHQVGAKHSPDSVHAIIEHHGYRFDLRRLEPEQRIHFMGYIWRREWDIEASMIPTNALSQYKYPAFWPEREMVEEYEWKFIDHEGIVRPEAYVAYSKETGEEGPFSQKQVEKWRMEGLAMARWRMGEHWWGEIHDWIMNVEDRYDERTGEVVERKQVKRQDSGAES